MLEQLVELVTGVQECMSRLDAIEDHLGALGEPYRKRGRKMALAAARESRAVAPTGERGPKPWSSRASTVEGRKSQASNGKLVGMMRGGVHSTVRQKMTVIRYTEGHDAALAFMTSLTPEQRRRPLPRDQQPHKEAILKAAKIQAGRHSGSFQKVKKMSAKLSAEDRSVAIKMYDEEGGKPTFEWIENQLAKGGH